MSDQLSINISNNAGEPLSRRRVLQFVAGATATATLVGRGSLPLQAQGTPAATPVGQAGTPPPSEEVTFTLSHGVTTHGVFDYPADGPPPFPAVLLLQGSGPIDRDETLVMPDGTVYQPFVQIAAELTGRGMAVFRFDKRGVCPPSRPCDPVVYASQTKPILADDAALAYERMIANPLIDASRTAVLGHSEGTWLAPTLAQRFPEIRALVLIGTGLGPIHVLTFSQVTLPLLGVAPFDGNGDGALDPDEVPFADPEEIARFQQRIRPQGQLFLLRYEISGDTPRPVGLNPSLDANGDGKLDLLTEVRPVYEAFFAGIAHPLAVIEEYADTSILPLAQQLFAEAEAFDAALYASYQTEPMDQQLRALLNLPSRPRLLIVNGEHDDQTPASSAKLLADSLARGGYEPAPTLRIDPGLSHVLSPQTGIFAPFGADMQPEPIADIGAWLAEILV